MNDGRTISKVYFSISYSYVTFLYVGIYHAPQRYSYSLGDNKSKKMYLKMVLSALVIYGLISDIVLFESTQSGEKFSVVSTLPYIGFMAIQFIGFILGKPHAARILLIFHSLSSAWTYSRI